MKTKYRILQNEIDEFKVERFSTKANEWRPVLVEVIIDRWIGSRQLIRKSLAGALHEVAKLQIQDEETRKKETWRQVWP